MKGDTTSHMLSGVCGGLEEDMWKAAWAVRLVRQSSGGDMGMEVVRHCCIKGTGQGFGSTSVACNNKRCGNNCQFMCPWPHMTFCTRLTPILSDCVHFCPQSRTRG